MFALCSGQMHHDLVKFFLNVLSFYKFLMFCWCFLFCFFYWPVPATIFEPVSPIKEVPGTTFGNAAF